MKSTCLHVFPIAIVLALACVAGCASTEYGILACEQQKHRLVFLKHDLAWDDPDAIRWSWSAVEDSGINVEHRKWFTNPDEAKPVDGGRRILTCASGGGIALIDTATRRAIAYGLAGGNPHSVEQLPNGMIVAISSTGATIKVFQRTDGMELQVRQTLAMEDGHGLYWDDLRQRLWAVGGKELRGYRLDAAAGGEPLVLAETFELLADDGHELSPSRDGARLIITTDANIWTFDPATSHFAPYAPLPAALNAKSVSEGPAGLPTIVLIPKTQWWTDTVSGVDGTWKRTLPEARFYKARWALLP